MARASTDGAEKRVRRGTGRISISHWYGE